MRREHFALCCGEEALSQCGDNSPADGKVPAAGNAGQVTFTGKEMCSSQCIAEAGGTQVPPSHAGWEMSICKENVRLEGVCTVGGVSS